jgi:hypothetical protein
MIDLPMLTLSKLVFFKNGFRVKWNYDWVTQSQKAMLLCLLQIKANRLRKKTSSRAKRGKNKRISANQ